MIIEKNARVSRSIEYADTLTRGAANFLRISCDLRPFAVPFAVFRSAL